MRPVVVQSILVQIHWHFNMKHWSRTCCKHVCIIDNKSSYYMQGRRCRIVDIRKITASQRTERTPYVDCTCTYSILLTTSQCVLTLCLTFMASLHYVKGPTQTSRPASLPPSQTHTSIISHISWAASSPSTALRSFVFSSHVQVSVERWRRRKSRAEEKDWGMIFVDFYLRYIYIIYIDRWGNISTKLTKMGTEVWPRRSGTRSSISQESRHQCKKKRA